MHGEETNLSVVLMVDEKKIEVICSKESVVRNGLRAYFSYAVKKIKQNEEKKREKLRVLAAEMGKSPPVYKRIFKKRDANCIIIHEHLKTGLVEK